MWCKALATTGAGPHSAGIEQKPAHSGRTQRTEATSGLGLLTPIVANVSTRSEKSHRRDTQ
jgi:hypothetical protein